MSEIINFIKRFLKWIFIFILLIILLIGGSLAFINYNERLVTMFALECEVYEHPLLDELSIQAYPAPGPDYYLFKRMNKSDVPHSIYVGINTSWDQTYLQDQKIYKIADLYRVTSIGYYFENIYDRVIYIDRKTLEMNNKSKEDTLVVKSNCKKISEEMFFENIEKQINQENEGNQI